MHPRYFNQPAVDHYEGTGVSISKDDGRTWSPVNVLNDAGRLHANLLFCYELRTAGTDPQRWSAADVFGPAPNGKQVLQHAKHLASTRSRLSFTKFNIRSA
jgi:hypothetical protein